MATKSIQEPKDIFCSVYRKDFIFWEEYDRAIKAIHDDAYRLTPQAEAMFLGRESGLDIRKMETYIEQMKELNRLRLRTLYSIEYPPKSSYKALRSPKREQFSPKNDKFLTENAIKFGPQRGKVLAPLPTTRRILGFIPYDDYRTPLSVYQDVHARLGYERVRLAAEAGFWRMSPKFDVDKEMEEIDNTIRRGTDILTREDEERASGREIEEKQMTEDRENAIRRELEKREKRKRTAVVSSRFGRDPRIKSIGTCEP